GGQRIGDLILDHLRRLPRILRVDDDLGIRQIGNGIERQMEQGIEPGCARKAGSEQYQQQVAGRPGDDTGDHGRSPVPLAPGTFVCGVPPASTNPLNAAFRLLSASIRKLADVTTDSPSPTPSMAST